MTALRLGELFAGYGGLGMGVAQVLDVELAWVSEIEPAPSRILGHRFSEIPNLGDITAVDWSAVEPVDVLTGGFPCQDVSAAGKRAGLKPGTRTGLWSHMADAIDQLRPRLVVAENVRGLLSAEAHSPVEPCPWCLGDGPASGLRALGAVLGDLADIGYDARWCGLRAADIGAPHGRFRVFVVAWPAGADPAELGCRAPGRDDGLRIEGLVAQPAADAYDLGQQRGWRARDGRPGPADRSVPAPDTDDRADDGKRARQEPGRGGQAVADTHVNELAGQRLQQPGRPAAAWGGGSAPADPASDGRDEGRPEPAGILGRPDAAERSAAAPDAERGGRNGWTRQARRSPVGGAAVGRDSGVAWGSYEPAVRRWERVLGRVAPSPTEPSRTGSPRLSPRFVEWMQGLDDGWVTDVPGISRNDQLKALGNGVVPQQAAEAMRRLLAPHEAVRAA